MKIKFDQVLLDLNGDPLKNQFKKDLDLKEVCVMALLSNTTEKDGEKEDGNKKMSRFLLAEKIQKAKELGLRAEEIVLIKNLVTKLYGPLVVGRVFNLLEGRND